jgi:CheY-like chemotaxis protein
LYEPTGVVCDIILPKSSLADSGILSVGKTVLLKSNRVMRAMPATPRLLLVEDSFLIILVIEGMCDNLGWQIVGPATRVEEAIELARTETFDIALIDVNLDGDMSWAVTDILKARGIPFVFGTGYNEADIFPVHLKDSEIVAKPYRLDVLERRLRQIMTGTGP